MEKDYKAYVSHILESITLIEKYTEGMTFEEFERDKKTAVKFQLYSPPQFQIYSPLFPA